MALNLLVGKIKVHAVVRKCIRASEATSLLTIRYESGVK